MNGAHNFFARCPLMILRLLVNRQDNEQNIIPTITQPTICMSQPVSVRKPRFPGLQNIPVNISLHLQDQECVFKIPKYCIKMFITYYTLKLQQVTQISKQLIYFCLGCLRALFLLSHVDSRKNMLKFHVSLEYK